MKDCLFCKIVNEESPSYTLYEDEIVKVFLDVYLNGVGHTLIIPKEHYLDLDDIPMEVLSHIMQTAKKIKKLLEEKLNPNSVALVQNNGEEQKVKHYHLHLIPKYDVKRDMSVKEVYELLCKN